ncbi:hypothetical protein EJ04DRAFT_550796 [Polyplosphaeria fusca]|uniref:Uncharacterized protein n=1 Tax=Polyplosphaeria fusca TaxID=682080 RepID=A0A9P4R5I1_9PLEO|nr:hypothetical protein EJ04DRAFT_550796 [Polyplosphaeria fusca]
MSSKDQQHDQQQAQRELQDSPCGHKVPASLADFPSGIVNCLPCAVYHVLTSLDKTSDRLTSRGGAIESRKTAEAENATNQAQTLACGKEGAIHISLRNRHRQLKVQLLRLVAQIEVLMEEYPRLPKHLKDIPDINTIGFALHMFKKWTEKQQEKEEVEYNEQMRLIEGEEKGQSTGRSPGGHSFCFRSFFFYQTSTLHPQESHSGAIDSKAGPNFSFSSVLA